VQIAHLLGVGEATANRVVDCTKSKGPWHAMPGVYEATWLWLEKREVAELKRCLA
jgi:hypothetical protein